MDKIAAAVLIALCAGLLVRICWLWQAKKNRRKGVHLPAKRNTLFDVREYLRQGDKETAVRTYCQIFSVSQQEARKAVEELERSLKSS